VKEVNLEFNAKISSAYDVDIDTSSEKQTRLAGSIASQSSFRSTSSTDKREFSMKISVTAVQDEIPTGLAKLLSALEEAILQSED
jgi:hypothetical protein